MIYRFDRCSLDTETRLLFVDRSERHVEPKVFDLLRMLLEQRSRVVTKEELLERIWAGRIVSDATLSTAVSAARRAIGDDGSERRLIRTVHGRGFQFIGAVESESTTPAGGVPATELQALAAPAHQASIAILPFENLSGDPAEDYFAEGLSEDLVVAVSRMRWLFVVAYGSTRDYRGSGIATAEVARQLGVRYLVLGSVRSAGRKVRLTCRLTDAAHGRLLWSDKYDGELADVFMLQDQITERIATSLNSEVTLAEIERAQRRHPDDPDAWNHYLRALPFMHALSSKSNDSARRAFEAALAADPRFAPAHAGLAWCHGLAALHGWTEGGSASLDEARAHAERAVSLDPDDPRAHCAMALVHFWNGRQKDALASTERAIDLDPNLPEAYGLRGNALALSGEAAAALGSLERALRGSPRDPGRWFWMHGMANACFALERYGEALEWARRTAEIRPGWVFSHLIAAASAGQLGQVEEARKSLAQVLATVPKYSIERFRRKTMWTRECDVDRLIAGIRVAGLT